VIFLTDRPTTGGGELMGMIAQLMRMANIGGDRHGRRHRRR